MAESEVDVVMNRVRFHYEQGEEAMAMAALSNGFAQMRKPQSYDPFDVNVQDAGLDDATAGVLERIGVFVVGNLGNVSLVAIARLPMISPRGDAKRLTAIINLAEKWGITIPLKNSTDNAKEDEVESLRKFVKKES